MLLSLILNCDILHFWLICLLYLSVNFTYYLHLLRLQKLILFIQLNIAQIRAILIVILLNFLFLLLYPLLLKLIQKILWTYSFIFVFVLIVVDGCCFTYLFSFLRFGFLLLFELFDFVEAY